MKREFWLSAVAFSLTLVSLGLAAKAAYSLLNDPAAYTGVTGPDRHPTHASLVQINGQAVISTVLFPVAVVLVPVLVPRRKVRIGATILIWAFTVLGSMTIGLWYVPAALAILVATGCGILAESKTVLA